VEFCDVTLASDDDFQIEAHKIVLSSCSPVFKHLLLKNKHPKPLIYLRGIKKAVLDHILDYVYKGEVSVAYEHLNSFLSIADELKLKGLTRMSSDVTHNEDSSKLLSEVADIPLVSEPLHQNKMMNNATKHSKYFINEYSLREPFKAIKTLKQKEESAIFFNEEYTKRYEETSEPLSEKYTRHYEETSKPLSEGFWNREPIKQKVNKHINKTSNLSEDYGHLESVDQIKMEPVDPILVAGDNENQVVHEFSIEQTNDDFENAINGLITKINHLWYCKACGKEFTPKNRTHLLDHVEKVHTSGFTHLCQFCGKHSPTKSAMRQHKRKDHKDLAYIQDSTSPIE